MHLFFDVSNAKASLATTIVTNNMCNSICTNNIHDTVTFDNKENFQIH